MNANENSEDLTDEEIASAIVTYNGDSLKSTLAEALQGRKVESYALRRRIPHTYCRVVLTEGALVFQVDWITGDSDGQLRM